MLQNPPKAMPQTLRKMYAHFVGYYTAALELRRTYSDFFRKNSVVALLSDRDVINFTVALHGWMIREQIAGIARMVDPAQSRSQKNLSLEALVLSLPPSEAKLRDMLLKRAASIKVSASSILRHRHKHISHSDLGYSTGKRKLRLLKHKKIDEVLGKIGKILHRIHYRYERSSMDFTPPSLARPFVVRLAKAMAYDDLESARTIPRGLWTKRMPAI